MNEQKKTNGAENSAEVRESEKLGFTTEEKAQYEVFRNGNLPRETVHEWVNNDLKAIMSFVSGVLRDPDLNDALVDAFYLKYKKLHAPNKTDQ